MSQWLLPLQTHSLQPSHSFELCKHHRKRLTFAKVKNPSDLTATCRNLQQLTTVRSMSPFEQMDDAQQMSSAPGCLDGLGRVGPVGPLGLKTFWNKGHGRDRGPHSLWQPQDQPPNPSKSNSLKVVYQCSPSFSLEKNGKKYVSIVSIPFWRISPDLERLGTLTQWTTERSEPLNWEVWGHTARVALRAQLRCGEALGGDEEVADEAQTQCDLDVKKFQSDAECSECSECSHNTQRYPNLWNKWNLSFDWFDGLSPVCQVYLSAFLRICDSFLYWMAQQRDHTNHTRSVCWSINLSTKPAPKKQRSQRSQRSIKIQHTDLIDS